LSQTDETALSKVGGENTYTKKSRTCAWCSPYMCSSLCAYVIYLFFEEASSV